MKRRSVNLTEPMVRDLQALSKELDLPISALVRMAVHRLLKEMAPKKEETRG